MRNSKSPLRSLTKAAVRLAWARLEPGLGPPERSQRSGQILAEHLGSLRGVYTKLGQELARRSDLFSDEFCKPLSGLVDRAPAVPFALVRRQIERSLGTLQRFSMIDPEPLGTASIAQVHRARTQDGRDVAVKVRHPELTAARVAADVRSLRRALRVLHPWLRGLDVDQAAEEIGQTLVEEVDLEREAGIAEAVGKNLRDDARIVVPRVHWDCTADGVVTYDFVPGIRLDDPAAIQAGGATPQICADIASDAYGLQIFAHGLFHADPHAGNLFLVDEANPAAPAGGPGPRLLFLDFGLAQQLEPELVDELRLGFKALLIRDVDALLAGLQRAGVLIPGREKQARAAAERAFEAGAADALGAQAAGIQALKGLAKEVFRESRAFRLPRQLLLYARTLAYVYDLVEQIAPGTDPMRKLLPHVLRFVTQAREPGETAVSESASEA